MLPLFRKEYKGHCHLQRRMWERYSLCMLITLITVRVLLNSEKCGHGLPLVWDKPRRVSGSSESSGESRLRASAQLGSGAL